MKNTQLFALLLLATTAISLNAYNKNYDDTYDYEGRPVTGVVRRTGEVTGDVVEGTGRAAGNVVEGAARVPGDVLGGIFGGGKRREQRDAERRAQEENRRARNAERRTGYY